MKTKEVFERMMTQLLAKNKSCDLTFEPHKRSSESFTSPRCTLKIAGRFTCHWMAHDFFFPDTYSSMFLGGGGWGRFVSGLSIFMAIGVTADFSNWQWCVTLYKICHTQKKKQIVKACLLLYIYLVALVTLLRVYEETKKSWGVDEFSMAERKRNHLNLFV